MTSKFKKKILEELKEWREDDVKETMLNEC